MNATTVIFEYRNEMQGRSLHWYAKALYSKGKTYLATATALDKNWAVDSAQLKPCVDSFQPDSESKPLAPKR